MRRPPPLPTPPEQERPAPAHEREPVIAREPVRLHPDHDRVTDSESSTDHDSVTDAVAGPAADPEAPLEVTARDVWRAARARRKRLRAEIRRFTQRSRRRRIIWFSVTGAVVVLIAGSVITAYSPLFSVQKITVVGASTLDAAAVEAALADQLGTPIALVDDSEVRASLMAFPLIESYALEAKPPHDLTVRIVERTPIGVLESDAGYTLVDAAGVVLSTTPQIPEGQPVLHVEGGVGTDAFASVGLVVRSLPAEVRSTVTEVSAATLDDVQLTLASGLKVVWGSAAESVLKGETLRSVLIARPDATTVDVSSPLVPVVG